MDQTQVGAVVPLHWGMAGWAVDELEVRLPAIPFAALPALSADVQRRVEREALRLETRYVEEALAHPAYCPRPEQRSALQARRRVVHYAADRNIGPLFDQMWMSLELPNVVTHVVFPLLEVDARRWVVFCQALTDAGHGLRDMAPALSVTALHPSLPPDRPATLEPIFLRAPDPMLRWVRLDCADQTPCCATPDDASVERVAKRLRTVRRKSRARYANLLG